MKKVTTVSQICRDALQSWVDAYERGEVRANEDGMQAVAEQLFRRLAEDEVPEPDWEGLGREDAKVWAELALPEHWEQLFHRLEVLKRQRRAPGHWVAPHLPGTKGLWDRQDENKEWFMRMIELDENTNYHVRSEAEYTRGFLSYLSAVWQMMSEKRAQELSQG